MESHLQLFVFFFAIVLTENDDEVHWGDTSDDILVKAPCTLTETLTKAGFPSDPCTCLIEGGSDIHVCNTTRSTLIKFSPVRNVYGRGPIVPKHSWHKVSDYVHFTIDVIWLEDVHAFDYVLGTKLDPDFKTIPHLPGTVNAKHALRLNLKGQRARMEEFVRMIEGGKYDHFERIVRDWISNINKNGYHYTQAIASTEFVKSKLESENYDELLRLLKRNLDSINIAIEAEIVTESDQISPRDLVELIAKAIQLHQQTIQPQIEKIERLQQVMEEEGAPILRRTKHEAEDEKQEETHLLLMLLVLWFLLCYCSDGTVWCVDVDLTFGLSLALSEIVLLLGGDIEKNPGPLSSTCITYAP